MVFVLERQEIMSLRVGGHAEFLDDFGADRFHELLV
jgi:hypothetical protein